MGQGKSISSRRVDLFVRGVASTSKYLLDPAGFVSHTNYDVPKNVSINACVGATVAKKKKRKQYVRLLSIWSSMSLTSMDRSSWRGAGEQVKREKSQEEKGVTGEPTV